MRFFLLVRLHAEGQLHRRISLITLNRRIAAMAAVNTNSVAAFVSGKGLIATTFEAFQRWNDVRRTRAVLSKLSDRELSDIGLCRGDIEDVAQKSAF